MFIVLGVPILLGIVVALAALFRKPANDFDRNDDRQQKIDV